MTETRPIPQLAKTAFDLLTAEYLRRVGAIGTQTVAALGLKEDENWSVDFDTGLMTRAVPDPPVPDSAKKTARKRAP